MSEHVISVHPETSMADAAILLRNFDISALPVVDQSNRLVGLFSERSMIADHSYAHLQTLLNLRRGSDQQINR